jgi:hypothetical protein
MQGVTVPLYSKRLRRSGERMKVRDRKGKERKRKDKETEERK